MRLLSIARVYVEANAPLTRRRYCAGLLGIGAGGAAAAAALAACGPLRPAPATKRAGPVALTYMSNLAETHPEGAARLALLDEFNQTNELQITVKLDEGRGATSTEKLKTLAVGGTPPDLAYFDYFDTADLFVAGATIDLDGELRKEKDWPKQRADIFPRMLEISTWDGKLVGMPGYTNNSGIIYNKGLLRQFGLAFPRQGWTWTDFREMALKMQRPPVTWAFSWPQARWERFLCTMGVLVFSKDRRKMTVDTPEALETLEYLLGLVKAGVSPPDGANELYRQAKNDIVFESQGPFRIPTLRQVNAPDFGAIHTPVHAVKKEISNQVGGHNVGVFKGAPPERRTAAALVAKWLNTPHPQAQMCIRATQIPVSKAAMNAKELQDYLKADEQHRAFVDLAPYNWGYPAVPSVGRIQTLVRATAPVFKQEMGIRAWLAQTQRETQVLLDADVALMK